MIPVICALAVALQVAPERVVVTPDEAQLDVGASAELTATVYDADGTVLTDAGVFWLSITPEVLQVTQAGTVVAVGSGDGRLAARVGNVLGFARISVRETSAASVSVAFDVSSLEVGTSAPLRVQATGADGNPLAFAEFQYSSNDESVAAVDRRGRVYARSVGETTVQVTARGASESVRVRVVDGADREYSVLSDQDRVRTGDVVRFQLSPAAGVPAWTVDGPGAQIEEEAGEGIFVAEEPGLYRVSAIIGERQSASALIEVVARVDEVELSLVGRGAAADHHSGDTWVFEGVDGRDYAYVGTFLYDWMKSWDVTDPTNPILTDSIQLDARRINDVKIHPNNRLGIVTREGASNRRNGIVLLDLTNPARPEIISVYEETITGGVHNVWIDGENDLVYAVHNGTSDIHIIDIGDPANPAEVGRWGLDKTGKTLHDVIVQEGYAYLSYWDDGMIMLDVGAGTHGGTPREPTFVSQFKYPLGNTHTAWRHGKYLFVGDEIFPDDWDPERPIEARGYIHVLDMTNPDVPVEVAKYEVPEAGAHNIWVEDDRLYVGYYQAGLRVVDVSGELRGDLYAQGRELAVLKTIDEFSTVPNWGMTWGAQIHKGNIYTSDLNSGLWILKLVEGKPVVF